MASGLRSLKALLHQRAVDLLELLKSNHPDKCGEKGGWNFDKAHVILHKVRVIINDSLCGATLTTLAA